MEIKLIKTQKALSPTQIPLADYVINPYRGCGFGCLYCYAQENKNIKNAHLPDTIYVKINIAQVLKQQLQYTRPKRILLGSTTECFQHQELEYGLSRQILEILNIENIPYTILTKSHLIKDSLTLISKNNQNKIYFTFNFPCEKTIRLFEKNSSSLAERVKVMGEIVKAGIKLRLHIGPFLPYVSNLTEIIKIMPKGITEIDVELYHHKMGNFPKILKQVEQNFGKETASRLNDTYSSEKNYLAFADELNCEIKKLLNQTKAKIFYIIPDFNEFYNRAINYNDSIMHPC